MDNGYILWEGPSQLDGKPIVVLATGFAKASFNGKTGDMIQINILRQDVAPHKATQTGEDESVCGDCKMRGSGPENTRACFVQTFHGPLSTWRKYDRGGYGYAPEGILIGHRVRVGFYGDPAAVPYSVWRRLLWGSRTHTGYTHQWALFPELKGIVMASVDTPEEKEIANRMGWRTFRSRLPDEPLTEDEIACPATREGGKKTSCEDCGLCDGKTEGDKRRNIAAIVHGTSYKIRAYHKMRSRLAVV